MNKVNLCWVISDGRKGHEIQSNTLAEKISKTFHTYRFSLRQPWETFAPRIIAGFEYGINWHSESQPNYSHPPKTVISTGRKAAAVAKFICQRLKQKSNAVKHIQILNPRDSFDNYDLILIPAHDNKKGKNVIPFIGSIHPYKPEWFVKTSELNSNQIAMMIGNPASNYFKKGFAFELAQIRSLYPNKKLSICGSPRLKSKSVKQIIKQLLAEENYWFDQQDGPNPYQQILQASSHIFVTCDSINMMNECAASNAMVTLLAKQNTPSIKHQRFIDSMEKRWSGFKQHRNAIEKVDYVVEQIINNAQFQKLLNSPESSSSG